VSRIVVQTPETRHWNIDLSGFWDNIQEDLGRRDFTVDALALPLSAWAKDDWRQSLIDPYHGLRDLSQKRIQAVHPHVFQEDPGRLLRAVRLASRLQFRLEPKTVSLIRAHAPELQRVSGERLRDEFLAIMEVDGARRQLEVLDRLDLLCRVIPELALTKGVDQPRVHYWDVWGHLIHSVETAELVTKGHQNSAIYSLVPWTSELEEYFTQEASDGHTRRTMLKLAALLHDIAKPQTKSQDETGRTRFLGHSELGAEMAADRLAYLRVSSRGIAMVSKMVEQHLRPPNLRQGEELPTHRAIYRYFRDLGDVAVDTLYLAMADYLAAKGPEVVPDDWSNHARMLTYILRVGTEQTKPDRPQRLITGHDLMKEFGLHPGPQIGALLEQINEARAAGEITSRGEALSLAESILFSGES
jgi:poly(A) polymerase